MESEFINNFQPADGGGPTGQHVSHPDDVTQVGRRGERPGGREGSPLQGIFEVGGGDGTPVMELHVRPQIKSIGPAVIAYFPSLGDIRRGHEVVIQAEQPAEYLQDIAVGKHFGRYGRVKRYRVDAGQVKLTGGRRRPAAAEQETAQRQHQQQH